MPRESGEHFCFIGLIILCMEIQSMSSTDFWLFSNATGLIFRMESEGSGERKSLSLDPSSFRVFKI